MAKQREKRPGQASWAGQKEHKAQIKQLRRWLLAGALTLLAVLVCAAHWMDAARWDRLCRRMGFASAAAPVFPEQAHTALHFIDVGQGDAVLIQQGGACCLIDAGPAESRQKLLNYLDSLHISTIELLVMTHPEADHIGGVEAVLQHCTVRRVLLPAEDREAEMPPHLLERISAELARQQIPAECPAAGGSYPIGDGTLSVLAEGLVSDRRNDLSPVLRFEGPYLSFLNTGDGEDPVEQNALRQSLELSAAVFKAGHHGSDTSNSLAFLQAVHPDYVVVSCGEENPYGHPSPEALAAFEAVGAGVYRTDQQGSVAVVGTPEGVKIYTARDVLPAA